MRYRLVAFARPGPGLSVHTRILVEMGSILSTCVSVKSVGAGRSCLEAVRAMKHHVLRLASRYALVAASHSFRKYCNCDRWVSEQLFYVREASLKGL